MSLHRIYSSFKEQFAAQRRLPSRQEIVDDLTKNRVCDILVVGGGINGAAMAHLAALSGLQAVLLERADYAQEGSGRSGKLLIGAPWPANPFVSPARRYRDLVSHAAHVVRPVPLQIADAGVLDHTACAVSRRLRRWIGDNRRLPHAVQPDWLRRRPAQYLVFPDGVLDDRRFVLEHILVARQEGARCLNYALVNSCATRPGGGVAVGWTDLRSGARCELVAGIAVNCAGAWAPLAGRLTPSEFAETVRCRRISHYIFDCPWPGTPLAIPDRESAGWRVLHGFLGGTLVSATERDVDDISRNPRPEQAELDLLIQQLSEEFPEAGFERARLRCCYSALRLFPAGRRRMPRHRPWHRWVYSRGMLTLLGGGMLQAAEIADGGLRRILSLAEVKGHRHASLTHRTLPGSGLLETAVAEFREAAERVGLAAPLIADVVGRLGSRVRMLLTAPDRLEPIAGRLLRGEIDMALDADQAETLEDLMARRLECDLTRGQGADLLEAVAGVMGEQRRSIDIEAEKRRYLEWTRAMRPADADITGKPGRSA